ncbi:MAG: hypothetical protein NTV34_15350 [Proteobacteria bacterium]|nr:hypothetical protein [Pseudomonadota bacterium]
MLYSPKSKEILGLLPPENRTGILQDLLAMDHNSFTKPLSTAGFQQSAAVYTFVDNAPKAVWELRSDDSWPHFYLPIRGFREVDVGAPRPDSDRLQTSGLDAPALTFLSSGTTSLGKMRSKSLFSLQGAQNYRAASLAAFSDMLQLTLGRASEHVSGISLVPPKSSWPDSSLAQMIDWIKDFWKLTYMEQGDVEGLRRAIDLQSGEAQRPIFVFGTALHFHDLLNGGLTFKLPPGSLIIETGGTKGKTSYTTREELYDKLGNSGI